MILAKVEINIEDAFGSLTSTEQMVFAKYVFENLSEFNRKILLSTSRLIAPIWFNYLKSIKEDEFMIFAKISMS